MFTAIFIAYFLFATLAAVFELIGRMLALLLQGFAYLIGWLIPAMLIVIIKIIELGIKVLIIVGIPLITFIVSFIYYTLKALIGKAIERMTNI